VGANANPTLPSLKASFVLDWNFNAAAGAIPAPQISLNDVRLDVGTFLRKVRPADLGPAELLEYRPQGGWSTCSIPSCRYSSRGLFDVLIQPLSPQAAEGGEVPLRHRELHRQDRRRTPAWRPAWKSASATSGSRRIR